MTRQAEDRQPVDDFNHEPSGTGSNFVVLAGGKGGTGTSSVAALMGLGLARAGRRVLLVDCGQGSLHLLMGVNPEGEALTAAAPRPSAPTLEWVAQGLAVLQSRPIGPRIQEGLSAARRTAILSEALSLRSDFDWILMDAGAGSESVLHACSLGPDRLLAVTDAGRVALAKTFALLREVSTRLPRLPMQLVVNRERQESLRRVDGSIRGALQNFHQGPVDTAGLIPFDPQLEGFTRGAGLLQDLDATSPAARAALRLGLTIALGSDCYTTASEETPPVAIATAQTPALAPTGS